MANIDILAPFILSWEGSTYTNHPLDAGGPTKYGITLKTWQAHGRDLNGDGKIDEEDVKLITEADAVGIMKKIFWDKMCADRIESQSVANLLVDFAWGSGPQTAAKAVQGLVGVKQDGAVGDLTLGAINGADPKTLFNQLHAIRLKRFDDRVKEKPDQIVFLDGWKRRVNNIQFGSLTLNDKGGTLVSFDDNPVGQNGAVDVNTPEVQETNTEVGKKYGSVLEMLLHLIGKLFK